jgi:hypothetical protein
MASDFGSSMIEDFHGEALPGFSDTSGRIVYRQQVLITT